MQRPKPEFFYDIEQGSEAWMRLRAGVVTASELHKVIMEGQKRGSPSKTRRKYMLTLIAEQLSGEPAPESFSNQHTERGKAMEAEAREHYAFMSDEEPRLVGFIKKGRVGCSPDSLIGDVGLLEIKTKLPDLHLETVLADELPSEHRAQVHGQLWVAEREFCDFVSYWPRLPPFIKRVYRDEAYIKMLEKAVNDFIAEMDALKEQLTGGDLEERLRMSASC